MGIRHRPAKGATWCGGVLDLCENFRLDPAVAELFETLDTPTCDDLLCDVRAVRGGLTGPGGD